MEERISLLLDYAALARDLGGYCADGAQESQNALVKNKYTFLAHSLLTIPNLADLVIRGVNEKNNILIFSGLRMIEESNANVQYVFHDPTKKDDYISKILKRGIEYQQAFTEIRNNPELGMRHLSAVGRWSGSTITQRVARLGEGPEFRYEMACKYLHSDIWTLLNDEAIKNPIRLMYGQLSWAIEDIQSLIYAFSLDEKLSDEYNQRYDELANRVYRDFENEPAQTYH